MRHSIEPLEVMARKVRSFYKNSEEGDKAFLNAIRDAIYGVNTYMDPRSLLRANATLDSIVKLWGASEIAVSAYGRSSATLRQSPRNDPRQ
jgi:hypothetical protein